MTILDNIKNALNPPAPKSTVVPGNQPGKGYPVFQPARGVATNDGEPTLNPDGTIGNSPGKNYNGKIIHRIILDCTNAVTLNYRIQGSLVWFSGQNGGSAAPIYITLNQSAGIVSNDPIQFVYDRAISGIPFQEIIVNNPTAQPGITIEITVILDEPRNRVGLNG